MSAAGELTAVFGEEYETLSVAECMVIEHEWKSMGSAERAEYRRNIGRRPNLAKYAQMLIVWHLRKAGLK